MRATLVGRQSFPRPAPTSKAAIIEALKQSTAVHIFIYNIVHSAEDYGVITTYLHMQEVMPSSSALDERSAAAGSTAR